MSNPQARALPAGWTPELVCELARAAWNWPPGRGWETFRTGDAEDKATAIGFYEDEYEDYSDEQVSHALAYG